MTAPTHAVFPRRRSGQSKKAGPRTPVVITLDILKACFHLPMPTASEKLGICTTAIKKLCRKFGIKKWPYRTLMSTSRRSKTSNFEDLMSAIERNTLKNDPTVDPVKLAQDIRKNFSLEAMQNKVRIEEQRQREAGTGEHPEAKAAFDSGVHALLDASKEAGLDNGPLNDNIIISEAQDDAQPRHSLPPGRPHGMDPATLAAAQARENENQMMLQQALFAKQLPQLQLQQLAQLQQLQNLQQMMAIQALATPGAGLPLGAGQNPLAGAPGTMPPAGMDPSALALAQAQLQAAALQQQLAGMNQMILN